MKFVQCNFEQHGQAILDIFNEEILNSTSLYFYKLRTLDDIKDWFANKQAHGFPIIGAEDESHCLLGFASYGTFRDRPAYKYSIEHSIYVHKDHRGKGVGRALLQQLIVAAVEQQYHMMIGGIDAENTGSMAFHKKLGFVEAGVIKQAGYKFGRWLDLAFYQLILKTPHHPVDG
jgi:L-amino acid N-acyltransferase YncA